MFVMKKYFIVGGAGFIGSHLSRLLLSENESYVSVYDNFSSGKFNYVHDLTKNSNFSVMIGDVKDKDRLVDAMQGFDVVYHFASNPDISKAVTQPDIDFWEGTYLTNNVLEAMRINNIKTLLYSSGSGVYGDTGLLEVHEDYSPLLPISTYGSSKLASEALINSYCYMFDIRAAAFRFANVVGPNQTHGVGFDFIKRLGKNSKELSILGDGTQSKSYIYITDILRAMRLVEKNLDKGFVYFNVATRDYITVTEIADIVIDILGLSDVKYNYTGGDRGWKGDVPIIRLDSHKIRSLGWNNVYSAKEAITESIKAMALKD